MFQIGNRLYVLVNFKLNQDYIAENLCEKKDEPESCCEGSCHLTQELNKVEEAEEKSPLNTKDQSKKEKTEEWQLYSFVSFFKLMRIEEFGLRIRIINQPQTLSGYPVIIDHPPSYALS